MGKEIEILRGVGKWVGSFIDVIEFMLGAEGLFECILKIVCM